MTDLSQRLIRYADLKPCLNAFVDTRSPGSDRKENFTLIGPGVSENPGQHVHIAERHGIPMPPSVPADTLHESLRADRAIDPRRALGRLGVTLRYPSYREGMPGPAPERRPG